MDNKYFELGSGKHNILAINPKSNNYDYDSSNYVYDPNLKNDGHIAVVRQIKNNSTVLDIGCASGILGTILTEHKNCIVDGIEYDKEAYKICENKNIYRNVYNFSISDTTSEEYLSFIKEKNKYDYVVFADVLEHLINPWDAIINATSFLKENGSIIVCIPNISHIDIIKSIIDGEFNYNRHGILDSTHLRFFTAKSFVEMIENIEKEHNLNFDITYCERILFKPPYFDNYDMSLLNVSGSLEDYLTLQNVFKLTLKKSIGKRNIDFVNHKNDFQKIIKDYNDKKKEIDFLKEKNKELEIENERLNKELNSILNSKRWKIANKALKIFHK